ncbi:MAG: Rne/Rng family ribonuclease [Rhodospirillales bacterium]|nr:Rne/Rng family ribonuclease [Rhodospirillales bacterium]
MSTNKMLIDAAHPEEIRVAVLSGNRLQDFDVESVARKQIKGNIYLAKVIRVEPSLQAAFVDYGGNRHGFLSFSEIHPDYYQIPIEDRLALLEHEAEEIAEEVTGESREGTEEPEDGIEKVSTRDDHAEDAQDGDQPDGQNASEEAEDENPSEEVISEASDDASEPDETSEDDEDGELGALRKNRKGIETLGGDDAEDARPNRRTPSHRRYKIQEVIKRRQILLIQVVKEERGNKGAALTTYISLAGRYCVLMPNTARGGGISRKITNGGDRKQLKAILSELKIPEGMAVIVRTAGIKRTRTEIKRDYEYLVRLWDSIRDLTLESTAPSLVHEEGNLIKRSIRDLYTRDIEEIIVAGDRGYRMAKDFIKLLIPSHAKRVQPYSASTESIFQHYQVESQLDAIHSPEVQMKSGAYIVINPTEALVSIDVNSGRSTRERNIEETAYKTNLEAADEIARQLRLRDLAGLIVIDFIDMEVSRNNVHVEKRLKDAMRNDRARIQIGRISPFGLLEMSRQRLRMSLIETSSEPCPFCGGTGIRRSTDSAALVALRAIQEEANRQRASEIITHVPTAVALYILNQKRPALWDIEQATGIKISVTADEALIPPDLRIERIKASGQVEAVATSIASVEEPAEEKQGKRRRRPRRRKTSDVEFESNEELTNTESDCSEPQDIVEEVMADDDTDEGKSPKRRRRGKRGGRRRRGRPDEQNANEEGQADSGEAPPKDSAGDTPEAPTDTTVETQPEKTDDAPDVKTAEDKEEKKPARKPARRRSRAKKSDGENDTPQADADSTSQDAPPEAVTIEGEVEAAPEEKPKRQRRTRKKPVEKTATEAETKETALETPIEVKKPEEPEVDLKLIAEAAKTTVINIGDGETANAEEPKRGWWRR